MRAVKIVVGGVPTGQQRTWAYPSGFALGQFQVPVYPCFVTGTDAKGQAVRERFDVLRFGVQSKDGKSAAVVGLADFQSHVIKAWLPHYRVHSASSPEDGAWQVYGNFLIHDGPDSPSELFASIGCIEIMGKQGFVKFNDLIISLAGPSAADRARQLAEIGNSTKMMITYEAAKRPELKRLP